MKFLQIHLSMHRGGAHTAVKNVKQGLEILGHRCLVETSYALRSVANSICDFILFHSFCPEKQSDYFAALQEVQKIGIPHAVVLHDYWPICHQTNLVMTGRGLLPCTAATCEPKDCGWPTKNVLSEAIIKTHPVVCFTDSAAQIFRNKGFSVSTIPHGIDLNLFHPFGGERSDKFRVFFTNAWGRKEIKGFRHWEWLKQKVNPDIEMEEMLGGTPLEEMPSWYSSCDCTLFLSLWEETFGLTVIESLACGTPVISFPVGIAPAVLRDGENGFLVPSSNPKDALARIEEMNSFSQAKQQDMRERSRHSVEGRFGLEQMAQKYVELAKGTLK